MSAGKTLFAQVMAYVPWKAFGHIIDRHGGDSGVRTLELRRLVSRHGILAIDVARIFARHRTLLGVQSKQTVHMGLSGIPAQSALSGALNQRDWNSIPCPSKYGRIT